VEEDHVPVIPLSEVVGNVGTGDPAQMVSDEPKPNVGAMFGFTVTLKLVLFAHCPLDDVKVYIAEAVLLTIEELQVPAIPLVDVDGRTGTLAPEQMVRDVPKAKMGVAFGVTVTFIITGIPHWLGLGVNV